MTPDKILVVYLKPAFGTLSAVRKTLEKHKTNYQCVERDQLKHSGVIGKDLVIAIGGDGTFLAVAPHLTEQLILGVNSNPGQKEGFLMRASRENFPAVFDSILSGRFRILRLARLQAVIDRKKRLPPALNEVYVGERNPFVMSVYRINVGRRGELQKSSGVIVSTATGSHAWARAAGGKLLPIDSDRFQFVVREPFSGRILRTGFCSAVLGRGRHVTVHSLMKEGIVSVDASPVFYNLKKGSEISIGLSENYLNFIEPV